MGWLKDLMTLDEGRFRSFGELSRALAADASWPDDMKIRERSLATVLSKLDRDQDLGWLSDRPDVQAVLARLLRCSVSELARPVGRAEAGQRKLRWNDLPYARTFDLTEEALPPTIPREVTDPARWDGTFWLAPSGSGRSLVGAWLRARGLAHFTSVPRFEDLPPLGDAPLFVELTSSRASVPLAPPARRLCVAGATAPSKDSGWRVVRTPAIGEHLAELVRWLLSRFPTDSGLDADSLLEWLRREPMATGEADGLGAVLGLAGALDRVGLGRARGKGVLDLARMEARRRFEEAFGADGREVTWQRRNAIEVLVAMARRALTDDVEPFGAARSVEEWTALVPDEHKSGLDVEWLRVSLARVDSSIKPSEVERAARRLSPGAFRIVRSFTRAGLLSPAGEERSAPAPRWMVRAVELEAERQLLGASPFEWGEALLRPHAASRLARRLFRGLRDGRGDVLTDVVELEAPENPAYAVAVETTFRCAGLALLAGAELDLEALGDLWDAARELELRLPGSPPLPRIEHPNSADGLLHRGSFFLASLALAEVLQRPWLPAEDQALLPDVCACIAAALDFGGVREPWRSGAVALFDRRRRAAGNAATTPPCALELPSLVVDLGTTGALMSFELMTGVDADDLLAVWRGRGYQDLTVLAHAVYRAWEAARCPPPQGSVLDPQHDAGRALFAHAPPELAARMLVHGGAKLTGALSSDAWRALTEAPPSDPSLLAELAKELPEPWLERWLARPELAPHVWAGHRRAAFERAMRLARAESVEAVVAAARGAPAADVTSILDVLSARTELGAADRAALARFMHELVGERRDGWREAYSFLSRLEG